MNCRHCQAELFEDLSPRHSQSWSHGTCRARQRTGIAKAFPRSGGSFGKRQSVILLHELHARVIHTRTIQSNWLEISMSLWGYVIYLILHPLRFFGIYVLSSSFVIKLPRKAWWRNSSTLERSSSKLVRRGQIRRCWVGTFDPCAHHGAGIFTYITGCKVGPHS